MTRPTGWCTAPAGFRPQHELCRYPATVCTCWCHEAEEEAE